MKLTNLLLLALLGLSISCSKAESGNNGTYAASSDEAVSRCAPMSEGNQTGFTANIQTVGLIQQSTFFDNVQVKLSALPTAFKNGLGFVEFYRYSIIGNQKPISDNIPLTFDIVPRQNIYAPNRGLTRLSYADIASLSLGDAMIVIEVGGKSSTLLELAYFSEYSSHIGSNYGLLPPFIANPDVFESDKRRYGDIAAAEIMKFHPLKNEPRGQASQQYKETADSRYCFSGLQTTMF